MSTLLIIIIALVLLVAGWLITAYNGLIRLRNRVEEAWSDINVQLKRRYDLIPNLVATVKGYAQHEQETLDRVITARNLAMQAGGRQEQAALENELSQTLKSIFALSESYPDLKANQNFLKLQDELSDTENKIQAARRFYNTNVRDFNTKLQVFPTNLLAKQLGFTAREFFATTEAEKENIAVTF
ncbi:MAG: LemA family protein [Candidatus Komeilibacteria bacterium]|nr:LemA family protein [Candidatus Komeilibacteria bacterium]